MTEFFVHTHTIEVATETRRCITDITDRVQNVVRSNDCADGVAIVSTPHTTAAILINENESRLHEDILATFAALVPPNDGYRHDQIDNNADAHLLSAIVGHARPISVASGALTLGNWQSVLFVELDGPRRRNVHIQLIGAHADI